MLPRSSLMGAWDSRGLVVRRSGCEEKQKKGFGGEIFDNLPHGRIGLCTGDE